MDIQDAAQLIQKGYDRKLTSGLKLDPLHKNGIEAYLMNDGTLVIPGTNDSQDWRRNVNVGRLEKGASKRYWHQGFLEHARAIYNYADAHKPRRVIGHSLGAAAAQILGVSWQIPAICFASPRPLRGNARFREERMVLNINRIDDLVTQLPPFFLFRHVGQVARVTPRKEDLGKGAHSLDHYLNAMNTGKVPASMPTRWA